MRGPRLVRVALTLAALLASAAGADEPPAFPLPPPDAHVVVVAPHPDDEVLAAGGLIATLARSHTRVDVVTVTGGDGYNEAVGLEPDCCPVDPSPLRQLSLLRLAELSAATSRLGLMPDAVHLLGFPDDGVRALWSTNWSTPWTSPHTGLSAVYSPYARWPNAPFTGQDLLDQLTQLIASRQPTLVLAPHPLDAHADHAATGWFVVEALRALRQRGMRPALVFYLIHDPCWPPTVIAHGVPLPSPPTDHLPDTTWRSFALDRAAQDAKAWALDAHRSQLAVMPQLLYELLRPNEWFGAIPEDALARMVPPHDAPLPPPAMVASCAVPRG